MVEVVQSKMSYFRFFRIRLNVCFCLINNIIIALFDYHCPQIFCEFEEQATCMPMSPIVASVTAVTVAIKGNSMACLII